VSIDKDGNMYLSTQAEAKQVNVNDLPALLSEKLGQSGERKVYVRGDGETPYRIIAYVLDLAKQAGAEVSLVTEPTVKKSELLHRRHASVQSTDFSSGSAVRPD